MDNQINKIKKLIINKMNNPQIWSIQQNIVEIIKISKQ